MKSQNNAVIGVVSPYFESRNQGSKSSGSGLPRSRYYERGRLWSQTSVRPRPKAPSGPRTPPSEGWRGRRKAKRRKGPRHEERKTRGPDSDEGLSELKIHGGRRNRSHLKRKLKIDRRGKKKYEQEL